MVAAQDMQGTVSSPLQMAADLCCSSRQTMLWWLTASGHLNDGRNAGVAICGQRLCERLPQGGRILQPQRRPDRQSAHAQQQHMTQGHLETEVAEALVLPCLHATEDDKAVRYLLRS